MPYKSNNTNHQSSENHGKPGNPGQPKGGADKAVPQDQAERDRITGQYTEDEADQTPSSLTRHPNRNPDKPELDKPAYGGGH